MEGKISFELEWDKFAAAVAYLTERSRNDDNFGVVKLVKLLYYADCAAYQRAGRPITGSGYIHMSHGPYPDNWQAMLQRLEDGNAITVVKEDFPNGQQHHRPLVAAEASTDALSEADRGFLDEQLRRFADFNGKEIEEYSHDEVAWRVTPQGQKIPYELLGIRMPGPVTDDVRARAQRIADHIRKNGRQPSRTLIDRQDAV